MTKPLTSDKQLLIGTLAVVLIILLASAIPPLYSWYKDVTKPPQTIEEHKAEIEKNLIKRYAYTLEDDLTVEIRTKDDGTKYCVGKISERLESHIPALVENYNAYPSRDSNLQISAEELRLALTEDLEATYQKRLNYKDYSSFGDSASGDTEAYKDGIIEFFYWCNTEADLVYKGDVANVSGTVSKAGDDAPKNPSITNYDYSLGKDDPSNNYCYRYEYEAEHPEAAK